MKVAFVVFCAFVVVAADDECEAKLTQKIIALNGDFFKPGTIKTLLRQNFDMYYKQNKTLKEIADYYYTNYNNIDYFSSSQIDQLTKVLNNITTCVGGPEAFTKLYNNSQQIALDFLKPDEEQVDNVINSQPPTATDEDVATAVCQKVFELATLQRKIEFEKKMWATLPENCLASSKAAISTIAKVHVV
ncbi:unnamed protein product [Bursaphelenchus okinawaensis]|uniref:DUF148 domain-containing protein n=1 Tax=Bursaphelenchus okinawaensis TaxID=465554 RepID=A0A811L0H6_9BILA|nr:unnamed protein product [Bursaphelenchus okinawaensis]CAG9114531.1 unnamed protein product [Bursaphelenchus okinawaensis]